MQHTVCCNTVCVIALESRIASSVLYSFRYGAVRSKVRKGGCQWITSPWFVVVLGNEAFETDRKWFRFCNSFPNKDHKTERVGAGSAKRRSNARGVDQDSRLVRKGEKCRFRKSITVDQRLGDEERSTYTPYTLHLQFEGWHDDNDFSNGLSRYCFSFYACYPWMTSSALRWSTAWSRERPKDCCSKKVGRRVQLRDFRCYRKGRWRALRMETYWLMERQMDCLMDSSWQKAGRREPMTVLSIDIPHHSKRGHSHGGCWNLDRKTKSYQLHPSRSISDLHSSIQKDHSCDKELRMCHGARTSGIPWFPQHEELVEEPPLSFPGPPP